MSLFKKLFGRKPKPEPVTPEPEQKPVAGVVPISGNYGVISPTVDSASVEQGQQLQQLALNLAAQHAALDLHASGVEAVIEQAQRLYGRQVQHQSRLQEYQRQKFPIDLLAAGLLPGYQQQVQTPTEPRSSNVRASAKKILEG
jgi:hypothetical protein